MTGKLGCSGRSLKRVGSEAVKPKTHRGEGVLIKKKSQRIERGGSQSWEGKGTD